MTYYRVVGYMSAMLALTFGDLDMFIIFFREYTRFHFKLVLRSVHANLLSIAILHRELFEHASCANYFPVIRRT